MKRLPFLLTSLLLPCKPLSKIRVASLGEQDCFSITSSGKGCLSIQPRQQTGQNNSTSSSQNANNSPFGGSFPVPYLAFGLAAIALFVLVVAFVLLRIFVRNRRLRRMGIYPEGPIDRLLGGSVREYEDNLAAPRLWEAKIAEVGAGGAVSEKATFADGEGKSKLRGWDALMPVSAALPPYLYPIIYDATDHGKNASDPPPTYPPPPQTHPSIIGRHMPQFLRRQTGEGGEVGLDSSLSTSAVPASATQEHPSAAATMGGNVEKGEDKVAASVNVTVLIAMPSSRTVFPSSRRLASSTSNASIVKSRPGITSSTSKLQEVEENKDVDQDESSIKGKAKRAPSLRSFKSFTSTKSVAEARREAFFNQANRDEQNDSITQLPVLNTQAPAYEEEEEELPELMFGTASVPIYNRLPTGTSTNTSSRMIQPDRFDILALVSAACKARERKAQMDKVAVQKSTKGDEVDLDANRQSVAETSLDGEGASAIANGQNERSTDDDDGTIQTPLGDVTTRMLQSHNVQQEYEMSDMGPSQSSYLDVSSEMMSPSTPTPLLDTSRNNHA